MKIGFIGLGIMGSRMAANLQERGYSLIVHNRTREKAETLLSRGPVWADSPAAVAAEAEIIFTMLAPTQAVADAALGENGFLPRFAPGRLWVDCSTVAPSFSREMAAQARARGIRYLDAPVSGSRSSAAQAALVFWVGGAATDLEACRPLLESMGNRIVHCGGTGAGASLKIVINQLLGTGMAAFAEAMVLGESLGLPRGALLDALLGGGASAPFLKLKRERFETGNYETADFPLRWLQKDLHLATTTAHETGTAMPLTNAAKELFRLAIRAGRGGADFSAVYAYLAEHRDVQ
ncbi:MAG: 3-hydroxyisobutyrate dehydrogenase/glyoxylate/succinic semialdehyde reductase [Verrucomicrobia bacterium]|nr:3-hydroxyisobutyrate dehydrogenase/glyoxylate/succinic semialdehyde reductase [Verrucomicrobiota bacterium]